jgi:hypothetical protein
VPKQQFNPVPKQHHQTLGEHCCPPGPVPDVAAPQHTRDKHNSSKWLYIFIFIYILIIIKTGVALLVRVPETMP